MTTWRDAETALESPNSRVAIETHRMPLFWAPRTPVLITGAAGSGKTELWRQLTGGNAADAMSEDPEDSYFYPGSRAGSRPWRKRRITLTTIPGQPSRTRYKNMNWFFGPETEINGVIFVATFGFDQVWPKRADSVASRLDPFCIQALSAHNIKQELESFRLTCEKIQEKRVMSDVDLGPRWMLVLVNKIDLYWDGREQAEAYYGPTAATPFNDVATRCLPREDAFADFEYRVLPITLKAADYTFSSARGDIRIPSQLRQEHADSSLTLLTRTLEELCGT